MNAKGMHEDAIMFHFGQLEAVIDHLDKTWWLDKPLTPALTDARTQTAEILNHIDALLALGEETGT